MTHKSLAQTTSASACQVIHARLAWRSMLNVKLCGRKSCSRSGIGIGVFLFLTRGLLSLLAGSLSVCLSVWLAAGLMSCSPAAGGAAQQGGGAAGEAAQQGGDMEAVVKADCRNHSSTCSASVLVRIEKELLDIFTFELG